eukprot:SAG31_NODE_831_length_11669_cov_3.410026_4_plen_83_part_00
MISVHLPPYQLLSLHQLRHLHRARDLAARRRSQIPGQSRRAQLPENFALSAILKETASAGGMIRILMAQMGRVYVPPFAAKC